MWDLYILYIQSIAFGDIYIGGHYSVAREGESHRKSQKVAHVPVSPCFIVRCTSGEINIHSENSVPTHLLLSFPSLETGQPAGMIHEYCSAFSKLFRTR